MLYYTNEIDEVIEDLKTTSDGLTQQEAAARLARNGPNEFIQPTKPTRLQ